MENAMNPTLTNIWEHFKVSAGHIRRAQKSIGDYVRHPWHAILNFLHSRYLERALKQVGDPRLAAFAVALDNLANESAEAVKKELINYGEEVFAAAAVKLIERGEALVKEHTPPETPPTPRVSAG